MKSTHFHCCSKSYWPYWLARYHGGWLETLINLVCWFSYVYNSFHFPMYGNEEMAIVTLHLHASIAQFGSILSGIRILASSIPIIKHHWFTVNFTMLKEQDLFFIWHLNEEANIFKLNIFGVKITTCSFPHIGKSNLRIKEWDNVRKISMRR